MGWKTEKIRLFSRSHRCAKRLLARAFPKRERLPMAALCVLSLRKTADFFAYYEDASGQDEFCGFSFEYRSETLWFLLYLAVEETKRSAGYGARILAQLKERSGGLPCAVCAELPEEGVSDDATRRARIRFYEKCGFSDTGYVIEDRSGRYALLTEGAEAPGGVSAEACLALMKKLSFGFYRGRAVRKE